MLYQFTIRFFDCLVFGEGETDTTCTRYGVSSDVVNFEREMGF